jgi:hypothetical protein
VIDAWIVSLGNRCEIGLSQNPKAAEMAQRQAASGPVRDVGS